MEQTSTDLEYLAAWQAGDRSAGEALIERHYDSIVRFFQSKVGAQADDLVQRTFLGCAEARDRFRGASSFRTFLFAIARNILFEHFRKRSKDQARSPDFTVTTIQDLNPGVATNVQARAEHRLLVEGLQRLPVAMQMAIELHYWEGFSVAEIAEIAEVPPGTIKSRLHRGRELVRGIMERLPADSGEQESVRLLLDGWARKVRDQAIES
jgi:RNA polymerase sigma-70 factor (ECF subfamily)